MKNTDVAQFIEDLDAGLLAEKLGSILSQVAGAVIDTGKQGKVSLTLTVKQIGGSHQVEIAHKVAYEKPTVRGSLREDNTTSTPMHVGAGGSLSFFPENQGAMFDKKGQALGEGENFPNASK